MKILKLAKSNHFLSLLSNAAVPALGVLIFAMLARGYHTKVEFGNWVLFQITLTLIDTFRTGFLQTAVIKFYAGASDEHKEDIARASWYLGIAITAAFCLVNFLLYFFYTDKDAGTHTLIKWIGITFLSTLPLNLGAWMVQAEGRFDKLFYIRILNQGLFLMFLIGLIAAGKLNFERTILTYLAACIITSLVAVIFGWTAMGALKKSSFNRVREMFHFGKYSVGTSVSSYLLKGSDTYIIRFMFGSVIGPAAVAVYNLPQRLMEVIEIPLRSFISVAMPTMSADVHKGNKAGVSTVMTKYAGILSIALIPVSIVGIILADLIVGLIGGGKYMHSEAGNVFRIFLCYGVLLPVDRFFGITLDILNQPKLNMIKVIFMLIVNVIFDFLGIFIFHNIYGVALGSIITFLAGVIYGYWAIKKHLDFSMKGIFAVGYSESKALVTNALRKRKLEEIEQ
jgi:O-antigen/teichoic acid export membrane protein